MKTASLTLVKVFVFYLVTTQPACLQAGTDKPVLQKELATSKFALWEGTKNLYTNATQKIAQPIRRMPGGDRMLNNPIKTGFIITGVVFLIQHFTAKYYYKKTAKSWVKQAYNWLVSKYALRTEFFQRVSNLLTLKKPAQTIKINGPEEKQTQTPNNTPKTNILSDDKIEQFGEKVQ